LLAIGLAASALNPGSTVAAGPEKASRGAATAVRLAVTATPIQHLVVIFQENESFEQYFRNLTQSRQTPPESCNSIRRRIRPR
jgi:phospholipase C